MRCFYNLLCCRGSLVRAQVGARRGMEAILLHLLRSGTLVVIQSPHNVTVTEGDTVQIQCCWNTNVSRATVNWHKEGHTEIKYNSLLVNNRQCHDRASQQTVACNCSHWTISNLTRNHTGTYICKVTLEIPSLIESVGNGTRITVTVREHKSQGEYGCSYPEQLTVVNAYISCIFFLRSGHPWESNPQPWRCKHQALPTEPHES
uniref:Ig-like domain-containing protein n=1 Tax=Salmo trutta TaxID=8032 RepID=A0A673WE49_SALTR